MDSFFYRAPPVAASGFGNFLSSISKIKVLVPIVEHTEIHIGIVFRSWKLVEVRYMKNFIN